MIHPTAKGSEQVNRKCHAGTRFYKFQLPTPTLSPQTPHLLTHRHWWHLTSQVKPHRRQAMRQHFYVWNSHHQHAAWLFQTMPYDRLIHCNSCTYCSVLQKQHGVATQCSNLLLFFVIQMCSPDHLSLDTCLPGLW